MTSAYYWVSLILTIYTFCFLIFRYKPENNSGFVIRRLEVYCNIDTQNLKIKKPEKSLKNLFFS